MKNFKKNIVNLSYIEFMLISLIFIFSFTTFNLLFSTSEPGSYYQNIISALIGTLLTVIITALLLKKQVKSEGLKSQNIEVFKKKVENYENFTRLMVKAFEDYKLDEGEVQELGNSVYNLALFSSEKTIEVLSRFIRSQIINDEEDIEIVFFQLFLNSERI